MFHWREATEKWKDHGIWSQKICVQGLVTPFKSCVSVGNLLNHYEPFFSSVKWEQAYLVNLPSQGYWFITCVVLLHICWVPDMIQIRGQERFSEEVAVEDMNDMCEWGSRLGKACRMTFRAPCGCMFGEQGGGQGLEKEREEDWVPEWHHRTEFRFMLSKLEWFWKNTTLWLCWKKKTTVL